MKLNIGCGRIPKHGFVNVDCRDLPGVDVVATADKLPFEDNSIDLIYSRHVIEHFTFREFLEVLQEWNRVLKIGGELYIICPALLWHLQQILSGSHESFTNKNRGENDRYWGFGSLFGWQNDNCDVHKFGYYPELISDILMEFGFENVIDLTNSPISVENEPWHLETQALKKEVRFNSVEESNYYNLFTVEH